MHRPTVGIIALVLLAIGVWLQLFYADADNAVLWAGACMRVGAVMAALWFALPGLRGTSNRLLMRSLLVLMLVVALRPRLFPLALVVLSAFALLIWWRKVTGVETRHPPVD